MAPLPTPPAPSQRPKHGPTSDEKARLSAGQLGYTNGLRGDLGSVTVLSRAALPRKISPG
ncbi:hypothetical protein PSEUDO9AZ_10120 [Pseudomonas sp. 9AZ]|nr:hypothetical protein PSEUDO9AZ_10120 [Pseudomonas sp. 9AZ]